jgi:isopentenyldiphosphate isomerase
MSYLNHISACNNLDLARFQPFEIEGRAIGWVHRKNIETLAAYGDVFVIGNECVTLVPGLDDFETRSAAVAAVVEGLAASDVILEPRQELYAISEDRHLPPLMLIERSAVPFFGIQASGVHMNGYVRRADGLHMWIARRASGKMTYPGMLDNMVAGGQPFGLGLKENMMKECAEEAGIPVEIAPTIRAVGVIDYNHQSENYAKPDRQYCYDLELPETFQPVAADGEVGEFMLWPIGKVAEVVRDTFEFKFNCNLVIIDFLIRHGVLDPDTEPDYAAICLGLRREAVRFSPGYGASARRSIIRTN